MLNLLNMKNIFKATLSFCLYEVLLCSFIANSQTTVLNGNTYEERANSMIESMLRVYPKTKGNIKYVAPFYFARLWHGYETQYAVSELLKMYQYQLKHIADFYQSGSDMDFFAHATMHGYLLTKDMIPEKLSVVIKSFMESGKYIRKNVTLNMRMMQQCSGFLCAEEWPDFVDADGNNASYLKEQLRGPILSTLNEFITHNCSEADAFTYIGTNLQYVRMLAEFARDDEIRRKANFAYQHIIAQFLLPWNHGLYCANPSRSKGWKNLYTGNTSTRVQIGQLVWLFYGNPDTRVVCLDAGKDNFACFNFWMAYQRKVSPLSVLGKVEKTKQYPYSFEALRMDKKHYYCRYTYQSENYGLSTQTVEAFPEYLSGFQYTYAFKETKNLHLVWQSDSTESTVFSVCHDNPERPQRYQTHSNRLGYGENPYHRVFGYEGSAIGVYNVPADYMDHPDFYRMYVPFSNSGILTKVVKEINGLRWILCHTGSMMFAFATPEEWVFEVKGGKFDLEGHDVLILKDSACRRGSWVLETTEIIPRYRDDKGDRKRELEYFAADLAAKTCFVVAKGYDRVTSPAVSYTNLQGNTLELVYFSPETAYTGNYRLNGVKLSLNKEYLSRSEFMWQKVDTHIIVFPSLAEDVTLN